MSKSRRTLLDLAAAAVFAAAAVAVVVWQRRRTRRLVVDSHLHVWAASQQQPKPPAQLPAELDEERASVEALIAEMDAAGVDTALIVQPSAYRFDHSYVLSAVRRYPRRLRVMMLANPALPPAEARGYIRRLAAGGCVGVRFNPYLWPEGSALDDATGVAMYQEAGRLGLPVGIMAFKGLLPLLPAIRALVRASPSTTLIVDHWGFPRADPGTAPAGQAFDEAAWRQLLDLAAEIPQLVVKVSALFRVSSDGDCGYQDLYARFTELVAAFGADRLMYGSDFPYVLLHGRGYTQSLETVQGWASAELSEADAALVMGGNAASLFGF